MPTKGTVVKGVPLRRWDSPLIISIMKGDVIPAKVRRGGFVLWRTGIQVVDLLLEGVDSRLRHSYRLILNFLCRYVPSILNCRNGTGMTPLLQLRPKLHGRLYYLLIGVFLFTLASCAITRQPARLPKKPLIIEPSPAEKVKGLKLPDKVKIGLRVGEKEVKIASANILFVSSIGKKHEQEWAAGEYKFSVVDGDLSEKGENRGKALRISSAKEGFFVNVGGKSFRGEILIVIVDGNISVINELTVDDYLRGVLPRECGALWPLESLKAQAVASRTYLVSHLGQHRQQGFDLCSQVHCQVYGGIEKEHPNTNQAIDETTGEILIYNGKPIKAFFHSNCGGSTEAVDHVWGLESQPYLVPRKCGFGKKDPRYNWTKTLHFSEILKNLKGKTNVSGSELLSIKIIKKSHTARAEKIAVETDAGTFILSGNEFRIALNPEIIRSTLWTNLERKQNSYYFEGKGWGHGVGMCQWGARGQADAGRNYRTILKFYYPHTELAVW